ncbi:MAG TPA: SLC13 family permease [Actinomycetota bacterium]
MQGEREPRAPRWGWILVAAATAAAGAYLAPDPWTEGEGRLEVTLRGAEPVEVPVEVGPGEPVEARAGRVELLVETGFPVDEPIEATVRVPGERPSLGGVSLALVLPDGARETIPILRREDDALVAGRRPPVGSAAVMGALGAVVILWVTEAIPLFVTSLAIPVALVIAGAEAADALSPFFHPIIALFFAGFLMAEAMRRTRLDRLAAISIVARAGRSPATLFAAVLGVAAFLSMWMSNTAAVAVLIPIALAVTEPLDSPGYGRAVILGLAYAATIGGVGSAIGTPANPLAIEFLGDFVGRRITFVGWFAYGLPMVVVFLPILGVYLWLRYRARPDAERFEDARRAARRELAETGPLTRDQLVVLAVFAGVVALWLTQQWHGLDTGIVALMGAIALAALGRILPSDLGRISWPSLLTFGGGLTLGFFLVESGTSDWMATRLGTLEGVPSWLAIAVVAAVALALTTVASNTATAAMLIPLAIPLAGILGVDPVRLVIVVAIASSIDFALVVGTPPTMLAYATGLYSTREIFRVGILLDVLGLTLLVTAVSAIWSLLGVV